MIGQTVSHYKILEELGGGGMGVVYKAEDTKLKRTVALKFLPSELTRDKDAKTRFIHEAQAASALQHHNICTIHEIDETDDGRMFISMDCYEGETLKERIAGGPLPVEEALDIAIQVAEGLAKAHAAGMVHRDIKPANIVITSDGIVKILDFGLAKLAGQTKLTKTGTTVGTVAYMSPEQARGEGVDARSDVFSLGAVLYEMLTGELPFKGDHEAAILYGIINTTPASVGEYNSDCPTQLQEIVDKSLVKNVGERYQSASHLSADLTSLQIGLSSRSSLRRMRDVKRVRPRAFSWRKTLIIGMSLLVLIIVFVGFILGNMRHEILTMVGLGDTAAIRSIAVLPFVDSGSAPDTQYLSDEIPASIINSLARLPNLRVIPRVSAFHFRDHQDDLKAIGSALDVKAVLVGQIAVKGDMLSIRVELVNIDKDRQLWGDRYTGTLDDILSTEDEIVAQISSALRLRLTAEERHTLLKSHTESPEAHRLYLKGRYHWNKRTREDLRKAAGYYEKAINDSPDYALAYAGLAETYALYVDYEIAEAEDAYPKAKAAAQKAIEIDETHPDSYTAMGYVLTFGDRNWKGAERQYKLAIKHNPNYANAHHWYAMLLYTLGRYKEALSEINRAQEIDPLSLIMKATKADVFRLARRYEESIRECRDALDMNPSFGPVLASLWGTYLEVQKYTEALTVLDDLDALGFESTWRRVLTLALAGREAEARRTLEEKILYQNEEELTPTALARIYTALGEKDRAFEYLERAFDIQDFGLPFIGVDPSYDPLRDDPRFDDMIRRLGLESVLVNESL
jgi:serine/threonine-protein kinase